MGRSLNNKMSGSYAMNSRVMIILAVLLVLGASIAGYLGYRATQEAQQAAQQAQQKAVAAQQAAEAGVANKVAVVVVRQLVPQYKRLDANDVALEYLTMAPPNTYRTLDEVLGQAVQTPLQPGQILEHADLQPGGNMSRLLQQGERAVAVPVDEVSGAGGFVQPGDRVDVLLFIRGPNGADSAQVVMQSLRVLGFGSEIIAQQAPDPNDKNAQNGGNPNAGATGARARTAVLAVSEKYMTRLMLASNLGTLRLSIHPPAAPVVAPENLPVLPGRPVLGQTGAVVGLAPVAAVTGRIPVVAAAQGQTPLGQVASVKPAGAAVVKPQSEDEVPTPAQRHLLLASSLMPIVPEPRPVAAPAPAPASAPRAHASSAPSGPVVIILRGLVPQKVSP